MRITDHSGFTLIEISVVLVIIGMLLLLVIPRLPSTNQENLKVSARTLAATLRYVQDRVETVRASYFIKVEPGTDGIRILEASGDNSEKAPDDPLLQKRIIMEGIQVADIVIPRLGKISGGQVLIDVGRGGLRDFVIFHLRSPEGAFWTVMAFPASRKVIVFEGYQEKPL